MTDRSPLRPQVLKGALVVYASQTPGSPPSRVIVFQFNPDQVKRTLAHRATQPPQQTGNTGAAREDAMRVAGPPVETISMTVELNASEQLEAPADAPNAVVAEEGLHPVLATLYLLMYPPALTSQTAESEAKAGAVQVSPADLAMVLLVWGKSRVVPVKVTGYSATEDAFDTRLNPIAAKVELTLQVLTSVECPESSLGRDAFVAYQQAKESLAALAQTATGAPWGGGLLPPIP
jgi:hypothetical protein